MGCNAGLMPPGSLQVTIGSDSRSLPLVAEFPYSTGDTVSFTTSALAAGSHAVSASYAGGAGCAAGTATGPVHVVEPRPSVSVIADPQSGSSQSFAITFSAPVTGLTAAEIGVVSTAGTVTRGLTGSGTDYVLTLTGMTQSGTLSVTVPASVAQTSAGSQNLATTSPAVANYLAQPVVSSVSPAFGPTAGGTSVTISGNAFTDASAVTFAGVPATSFTVNSPTSITATTPATVPADTPGAVGVQVTTPGGTNVANTLYTYRADQSIAFTDPADIPSFVPNQPVALAATATSGLTVTFTSATPLVCSVTGTTATVLAAGTCMIDADQPGNGNYNPAPEVSQSFDIGRADQSIAFTDPADIPSFVPNQPVTLTATATSGLTVTFASATPLVCSVTGTTATVLAAGTCAINANQQGNGNYNPAPQVSQSFDIGMAGQSIAFTDPADIPSFIPNQPVTLTATATSGLTVDFASATPLVCSVTGTTATVLAAGTCAINANQQGNGNYNAAPQVSQSFDIGMAGQSIAFTSTPPAPAYVNGPTYAVAATGGASSNPVLFSIAGGSAGICTIAGNVVSFVAEGTCVVNADQAGDGNHDAAPQASQSIAVDRQGQAITFTSTAPATAVVGGLPYTVSANGGGSGNPVLFSVAAGSAGICAASGSTISFLGAGTCTINADQAGDTAFADAPQVQQSFAVGANTAPTADAGPDQAAVSPGAVVTLDGSGSSDPDAGQVLTFTWQQTGGTAVALSSSTDAQPTFTAPILGAGISSEALTFQLTVDDGYGGATTDTVTVTIMDNTPPAVTITGLPSEVASGASFTATFTFSEPVTGFVQGDITLTNATLTGFAGTDAVYTATVLASGTGAVGLSVAAGAAEDLAGNPSLASGLVSVPLTATTETEKLLAEEALLASQPDLTRFLSGGGRGGVTMSSQGTGLTFDVVTDPDKTVWLTLSGRWGSGDAAVDRYLHGALGAHLLKTEGLIFGAMLQADHGERRDGIGSVEADGWLIGPYFVARFGERDLILSGSYLMGRTDLTINPIGTYTDMVTSDRRLVTFSLVDEIQIDGLLLRPRFDIARVTEDRPAYIDSLGNTISAGNVTLTEASSGIDFETAISVASGTARLSGGLSAIHALEQVDGVTDRSTRGRIDLGLHREFGNGASLNFNASYDGIGASDRGSLGLDILYSYRF